MAGNKGNQRSALMAAMPTAPKLAPIKAEAPKPHLPIEIEAVGTKRAKRRIHRRGRAAM